MIERTFQVLFVVIIALLHVLALSALIRGTGTRRHKFGWATAIILLPVVGVLVYCVWGQDPRDAHLPP